MQSSSFLAVGHVLTGARIRQVLYGIFGALFLFEFLNYLGVLTFRVEYTWLGRFISTFLLFVFLRCIDEYLWHKVGTRLRGVIWILLSGLLFFDFIGDIFGFYSRWSWYDQVAHFLSGPILFISLLLTLEMTALYRRWRCPKSVFYGLALGINTVFAVLYEMEEYLEDYIYHTNRLGDGPDTANDLLLNLLGAVLALLLVVLMRRRARM